MKHGMIALLLALCLCLTGCGWMDGYYSNVTPHQEQSGADRDELLAASNYAGLRAALEDMIRSGEESRVIHISEFDQSRVQISMDMAVRYVTHSFPIGAYTVEDIQYEIGTSGGAPAIAVEIAYLRSFAEIRKIHTVADMEDAMKVIAQKLEGHEAGVVLLVEDYDQMDVTQLVQNHALEHPDRVMEIPQVTVGVYPDSGKSRVLEIQLTYQNSRESLRQMQEQTAPLFTSAAMYVTPDAADRVKYTQLYTFLMERFDYTMETSITPSYSLLRYGVGDSRAFATVYAAMCRRAGLECMVVTGTRAGEPWSWNIVCDSGLYFHVDLLQGTFREQLDAAMSGYVWDYSAYPPCDTIHAVAEQPEPSEETTQPLEEEAALPSQPET